MKMSQEKIENKAFPMYNRLVELDCCDRCIIRFLGLGVSNSENHYTFPREYLNKTFNLSLENSDEIKTKKSKNNICPVCLYSYHFEAIEKLMENEDFSSLNDYQYDNFQFSISFPKCLAIRSHSMYLYLKKNFDDIIKEKLYNTGKDEGIYLEMPHKIFRTLFTDLLVKKIGKKYDPKSALKIQLTLAYEDDAEEIEKMKKLLLKTDSKRYRHIEASRTAIIDTLKTIDEETFINHFPVPPELPAKSVFFEKFQINADPLYLGGRYLKFKRNVGQTPWIIDGVSMAEHNVQDTIFDAVTNVLKIDKSLMTFTTSGREDLDVRMLGNGRPFYIKISNPKITNILPEQLLEIERQIIETELVAVIKLKIVDSISLDKIKLGEEQKMKSYKALCKTSAPNVKECVELINKQPENLLVAQQTVMRVLHRRTLLPRQKVVYKMTATEIPDYPSLFELVIATQAGTYIKEFVHGDFCRTKPSISSIIGYPADVLALDCTGIDLEWP